jgi:hypothetical protein
MSLCECGCGELAAMAPRTQTRIGWVKGQPTRFAPGHYNGGTLRERLEAKTFPEPNTGCWLWAGAVVGNGYGKIKVDGRLKYAHRVAYEQSVGPVPPGYELDHLCRVRCCVNPAHLLEPVTHRENTLRGGAPTADNARRTACPHGHEYYHAYFSGRPRRGCRKCEAARARRYRKARSMQRTIGVIA